MHIGLIFVELADNLFSTCNGCSCAQPKTSWKMQIKLQFNKGAIAYLLDAI